MRHHHIRKLIITAIFSAALLGTCAGKAFADGNLDVPLISSLPGQSDIITSISVNQDGNILASGSNDGTVKLYYVNSNKTVTISAHNNTVNKVIFNPQKDTVVSCGDDGKIKFWNSDTGGLSSTIYDDNGSVNSIAFNNDGSVLYSGDANGSVRFWDANTDGLIYDNDFNSPVVSIALDKINDILAVALKDNSIAFIDTNKKALIGYAENAIGSDSNIGNIAFSNDGKYLVCSGSNLTQPVILSCEDNYKKLNLNDEFEYNSFTMWNDVSFSSDDHYLIGSDENNDHVGIFNFYSGKLVKEIDVHPTSIALTKNNSELLVGNLLDNINIYDTSTLPVDNLKSLTIDAGGNYFVKGAPITLKVIGHYSDGTDRVIDNKYVNWQVSDKDSLMNNGVLIPENSGSINVTASYGGVNYTIVLNVAEEKSIGYIELNY